MEFPRYIQLDFLMVVIGLGIIAFSVYSVTYKGTEIEKIYQIIFLILIIVGFYFFMFGFYEMVKNYSRDNEIKDLQAMIEKKKLKSKLNYHKIGNNKKIKRKKKA